MPKSSKTQRTPPKSSETPSSNVNQILNPEPYVKTVVANEYMISANRSKRQRQDNSPQSLLGGLSLGAQDLDDKLAGWKEEQDNSVAQLLSNQTAIMSKLASDIGEIKSQNTLIQVTNTQIHKSNEEIVQSMFFMNKQFEEMKKEMEKMRKERQQQLRYIESLEQKITDLQRCTRSSGVEIRNIPAEKSESTPNLIKIVRNIGELVGVHITEKDMRDIYRLPGKSNSSMSTRPIITEFATVPTQQAFLSAVRNFNSGRKKEEKLNTKIMGVSNECWPVYVSDQLPATTKKLFFQARTYAKKFQYKFCWTSNGSVFLRKKEGDKQILISSEQCLLTLEEA